MIVDDYMMVSIVCQTYNHEKYISQCLQGLVKQQVSFRYEILIHDDASTDNTAIIIQKFEQEFPDLIKPIYQKVNQRSLGNKVFSGIQLPRCTGKYIAICEGDDYWTDPLKLQKQVDILESDHQIGLVYSKTRVYVQEKQKFADYLHGEYRSSLKDMIIKGNAIPTLTVMFRQEIAEKFRCEFSHIRNWKMGDYPLWLYIFGKYKVTFMEEVTGVYRIVNNSASHITSCKKKIQFTRGYFEIADFFIDYFNMNGSLHHHIVENYFSYVVRVCIQKQYKEPILLYRYLSRYCKVHSLKILGLIILTRFGLGRNLLKKLYERSCNEGLT